MKPLRQHFQQLQVPTRHRVAFASQSFPTHPGDSGPLAGSLPPVSPWGRRMGSAVGAGRHVPCFTRAAFLKPGLWNAPWPLALPSSLEPFLALSGTRPPHMAAFLATAPSPVDAGSERQERENCLMGRLLGGPGWGRGRDTHCPPRASWKDVFVLPICQTVQRVSSQANVHF